MGVAVAVVTLGVVAAVAFVGVLPGWVRGKVLETARANGVELSLGDVKVSPGLGAVELTTVVASLQGVPDARATAQTATLHLEGLEVTAVELHGVELTLRGYPRALAAALASWKRPPPPNAPLAPGAAANLPRFTAHGAKIDWDGALAVGLGVGCEGCDLDLVPEAASEGRAYRLTLRGPARLAGIPVTVPGSVEGPLTTTAKGCSGTLSWKLGPTPCKDVVKHAAAAAGLGGMVEAGLGLLATPTSGGNPLGDLAAGGTLRFAPGGTPDVVLTGASACGLSLFRP